MLKVNVQDPPFERLPESKAPLVEVTVWAALSLLVQVTEVPLATVSSAGLNANPLMSTLAAVVWLGIAEGETLAPGVLV